MYNLIQTIQSIWLSFQVSLQPGEINSCWWTLFPFFNKHFFCFFVFTCCFYYNIIFFYLYRFNFIFVSFVYLSLVLLQFSFARWAKWFQLLTNEKTKSVFSPRRLVRLTNLVTFKLTQVATLLWIFSSPPVLTINSLKNKLAGNSNHASNRKVFHFLQKKHKNIHYPEANPI